MKGNTYFPDGQTLKTLQFHFEHLTASDCTLKIFISLCEKLYTNNWKKDYREDERCRHLVKPDGEPTHPNRPEERWRQPSVIRHRRSGVAVKAAEISIAGDDCGLRRTLICIV